MTVNGGQTIGLFFVYGWRGRTGPFYVAGASTEDAAIARAREALSAWKRTVAKDVRTCAVVFDSEEPR